MIFCRNPTASADVFFGIKAPAGYEKTDGTLSYSVICVISGGTVRERTFLNEVEKKRAFKSLDIIFVSTDKHAGGLTPRMMQAAYNDILNDGFLKALGRKVQLDEVDSVYMFTDEDHYEHELQEILKAKTIWIINNPNFEIWLYYCYRDNPDKDLADVVNEIPSKRSTTLKEVNARFNNGGGLDTRKTFEHLKDGIERSKEHFSPVIYTDAYLCRRCTDDIHLKRLIEFRKNQRK